MKSGLRQLVFRVAPPVLSLALLAGIAARQREHLRAEDVKPYHDAAKAAIDAVPYIIGTWTASVNVVPQAAQKLLRPNAILSRTYLDNSAVPANEPYLPRVASLLIVQCRDSRDMLGHFPPVCYRAQGLMLDEKSSGARDWTVGRSKIPGYEYQFTQVWQGQASRTTVYNFLIVPGRGIVRDMKGIEEAAEDYQQRYYGAAQFQVVFDGLASNDRSREERDEMFATLIGPNLKLIELLTSGGLK